MGQKNTKEQVKKGQQYAQPNTFYIKTMIKDNKILSIQEQYTFHEKIGSGTYAEVFKAVCNRSKQPCAIKKVDKKKAAGIEMILQNQFYILRSLDHPNIVRIIQMFEDTKHIYIVSQHIAGKELFDYFKEKKRLTENEAYTIFYQTLLAVNYLHTINIMHRDIKLENIIYDEKNNILKLIDFGSSYEFENKEPIDLKCIGTVSYVAPEVINKFYNYKCDNWSLGVFLYLLLTSKLPFEGKDKDQTFKNITSSPLQLQNGLFQSISKEAKDLIKGLLQKDPKKRVQLTSVLTHPWIMKFKKHENISFQDQSFLIIVLKRLINFSTLKINEIQLAVLVFMINFVVLIEDSQKMIRCFHSIDFQGDGVITEAQLVQSLVQYIDYPQKISQKKAHEIMIRIDFNQSNDIGYSEFLVATAEIQKLLTDQNLQRTFSMIDTDNSGALQAKQLKNKLGDQYDMKYYHQLIAFFDDDKDGQISLAQFKKMMKMIIKT